MGGIKKKKVIISSQSTAAHSGVSNMTHCDVEPSGGNVAAGEVCGDGGGVEKATRNSCNKESNGKKKIRLTMSSQHYCKAHGEARVCCLTSTSEATLSVSVMNGQPIIPNSCLRVLATKGNI